MLSQRLLKSLYILKTNNIYNVISINRNYYFNKLSSSPTFYVLKFSTTQKRKLSSSEEENEM